ncbi:MAG: DUF2304 domain-containing protein [Lachnospiraceae bacterium]|nr:DUF2304 domain-containing protein [Lachnospiraceae bacterium]
MSLYLRLILMGVSLLSCIYVIRKIRKSKMKIESSISWFFFAFVIFLLSVFPNVIIAAADLIGVQSPTNLVYLIMIFITIGTTFSLSVKLSMQEHKINILTEEIAILRKQIEEGDNSNHE